MADVETKPGFARRLTGWLERRSWQATGAAVAVGGAAAFAGYAVARPLRLLMKVARLRLALSGIHGGYVDVDGYRIHFYEGGPEATAEKPPVVLVHGLGGYAEHWTELMVRLVGARRRVYAMDLLGYGESERPKDASFSIPQEAAIVEGFLQARGIEQYDLCGWSMGGWVSLQVALNENETARRAGRENRVRRLVLMNSAGLHYDVNWDTDVFVPDTREKLDGLNELMFPHTAMLPGFVANAVMREARSDGWVIQRSMDSMLAGEDAEDGRLKQLKMPVLIVWGKDDRVVPVSVGERMHAELPHSELEVFEGCGHLAPVKCAKQVGRRVVAFLDGKPVG